MAAPCCPSGSHGPLAPDDVELTGYSEKCANLDCYFTGQKDKPTMVILAFADVFGPLSGKHRRVCDEMAAAVPGSLVCLPDLFDGQPICEDFLGSMFPMLRLKLSLPQMIYRIRYSYGWDKLGPKIQALVEYFQESSVKLCCFGFCFGGYLAVKASSTGAFSGVVGFHPSLIVGRLQCSPHSQKDAVFRISAKFFFCFSFIPNIDSKIWRCMCIYCIPICGEECMSVWSSRAATVHATGPITLPYSCIHIKSNAC